MLKFLTSLWLLCPIVYCLNCRYPFKKIDKKCYLIDDDQLLSWFEAQYQCRRLNANLATIANENELNALRDELSKGEYLIDGEQYWYHIGGTDLSEEGKWIWMSTGEPLEYLKWATGEPNNLSNKEHCLTLRQRGTEFYMNDWICNGKAFFICEAETLAGVGEEQQTNHYQHSHNQLPPQEQYCEADQCHHLNLFKKTLDLQTQIYTFLQKRRCQC